MPNWLLPINVLLIPNPMTLPLLNPPLLVVLVAFLVEPMDDVVLNAVPLIVDDTTMLLLLLPLLLVVVPTIVLRDFDYKVAPYELLASELLNFIIIASISTTC